MVTASAAREIAAQVRDPELPMLTLADLGVLRDVRVEDGRVVVELTPTYSGCPALREMRGDVAQRLHDAGYPDVDVRTVLDPPWSSDDISEQGRALLAEHGIAPPRPRRVPVTLTSRARCPQCGSAETTRLTPFGATACRDLHRCSACGEPFEQIRTI